MSNDLVEYGEHPDNPADLGWPATFALELAMGLQPSKQVCMANEISEAQWDRIRVNPIFVQELHAAREALKVDGVAYKMRAKLQSLALLDTSWDMIHDQNPESVPASVRADLIKFTARVAGLDPQYNGEAKGGGGGNVQAIQVNINLERDK